MASELSTIREAWELEIDSVAWKVVRAVLRFVDSKQPQSIEKMAKAAANNKLLDLDAFLEIASDKYLKLDEDEFLTSENIEDPTGLSSWPEISDNIHLKLESGDGEEEGDPDSIEDDFDFAVDDEDDEPEGPSRRPVKWLYLLYGLLGLLVLGALIFGLYTFWPQIQAARASNSVQLPDGVQGLLDPNGASPAAAQVSMSQRLRVWPVLRLLAGLGAIIMIAGLIYEIVVNFDGAKVLFLTAFVGLVLWVQSGVSQLEIQYGVALHVAALIGCIGFGYVYSLVEKINAGLDKGAEETGKELPAEVLDLVPDTPNPLKGILLTTNWNTPYWYILPTMLIVLWKPENSGAFVGLHQFLSIGILALEAWILWILESKRRGESYDRKMVVLVIIYSVVTFLIVWIGHLWGFTDTIGMLGQLVLVLIATVALVVVMAIFAGAGGFDLRERDRLPDAMAIVGVCIFWVAIITARIIPLPVVL